MPKKVQRVKIYFLDGREVEVSVSPRAQVNTERHIGGDWSTMAILSVYRMAWEALRGKDKETSDFETFLDQIEDVEQLKDETADPTQPAQSSDSSLN